MTIVRGENIISQLFMGTFRFLYRFILFWIWSIPLAIYAVALVGPGWAGVKRLSKTSRLWAAGVAKIFSIKIKVYGDVNECRGLIVSNHLSYVDVFLLGAIFPLRFTPKKEIKYWPILGPILWTSRPIWVDRTTKQGAGKTVREISESLRRDINIVAFPEGTTTDGKGDLLPFKSTVFEVVAKDNIPARPTLIHYKEQGDVRVSWHDDETLMLHVWKLLKAKRIEAEVHILPVIYANGRNRKELAEYAHKIMNDKLRELYPASAHRR